MKTYTHSSQVNIDSVRPGTLMPSEAQRLAEVLELEAFHYSGNGEWYGFTEDFDCPVHLNNSLILRILRYAGVA